MSITAKRLAQIEWGGRLDESSFHVLNEQLGIFAFRVRTGETLQPKVFWNGIAFSFPEETIDDLYHWKNATKPRKE